MLRVVHRPRETTSSWSRSTLTGGDQAEARAVIKTSYDPEADAFAVRFAKPEAYPEAYADSEEVAPGVILDFARGLGGRLPPGHDPHSPPIALYVHVATQARANPAPGPMIQPRTMPRTTLVSIVWRPRARPVPAIAPIRAWFIEVK